MMDNVLRWGCVCDACDPHDPHYRYHSPPADKRFHLQGPKRPGPNYGLLLLTIVIGVALALYVRSL